MKNYFSAFADEYADEIFAIQPQFYKNAARKIDKVLSKLGDDCKVLDIGNGGLINYSFEHIGQLVCADISVSKKAARRYKKFENIQFCEGNMLDLKWKANSFDAVIVQTVIHHLAGNTFAQTEKNVKRGLEECIRVLRPGGMLLIVESTVKPWFERIERFFYSFMQLFFRMIRFDTVYQYSLKSLHNKINQMELNIIDLSEIELDKYIWLCRKKILTKLTPCGACWILIQKQKGEKEDGQ